MRDELIGKFGTGIAVVQGGALVDVFPDDEAAFELAMKKLGRRTPFLIRPTMKRPCRPS
jgi:hypothetical protein